MHIPDGFLSTPVWLTLDIAAVPAVALAVRRAQRGFEDARVPLLGVMGAFVFAAQMINFPVGVGTTGHLVGGALLAFTLGPAPAMVAMSAILAIQALVFQDGGILALGPNLINMAILGVLAGYLPFHLWGAGKWRKAAIFLGATLSLLVSAVCALAELLLSGVRMPAPVLALSLALFLVSALLEGAITLTVVQALEAIQPNAVRRPRGVGAVGLSAILLAAVGVLFASTNPDGIERLGETTGIGAYAHRFLGTPFTGYQTAFFVNPWLRRATAGLAGLALVYCACALIVRASTRKRSA